MAYLVQLAGKLEKNVDNVLKYSEKDDPEFPFEFCNF